MIPATEARRMTKETDSSWYVREAQRIIIECARAGCSEASHKFDKEHKNAESIGNLFAELVGKGYEVKLTNLGDEFQFDIKW